MRNKIIGISGKRGSGKSTAARIIHKEAPQYEIRAFADKLKFFLADAFGVSPLMFEDESFKSSVAPPEWQEVDEEGNLTQRTHRWYLANCGTNAMRNVLHNNFWVNALAADLRSDSCSVISDVRFRNEAGWVKSQGGILIRINRDIESVDDMDAHHSETALDNYKGFDYIINNNKELSYLQKEIFSILKLY